MFIATGNGDKKRVMRPESYCLHQPKDKPKANDTTTIVYVKTRPPLSPLGRSCFHEINTYVRISTRAACVLANTVLSISNANTTISNTVVSIQTENTLLLGLWRTRHDRRVVETKPKEKQTKTDETPDDIIKRSE
ncbi:unnamed protein product [Ectocarpus sp. 12 AP-2014]